MQRKNRLDVNSVVRLRVRGSDLYMPPKYKELHLTMGYEELSINLFLQCLKPDGVFVDVGAHIGTFTVIAGRKLDKKGQVYAFEPLPENIEVLEKNVEHNNLTNVKIVKAALSSVVGKRFLKVREDTGLTGFYEHSLGKTVKKVKVATHTLDEHFSNKKVDMIKIDTEGHEIDVLEGAKQTLKHNPQVKLLIELNPSALKNAGHTAEDLLDHIYGLGFEVYAIDDKKVRFYRLPNSERWRDSFPEYGYANLLCLPKGSYKSMLFFSHTNSVYGAERTMLDIIKGLQKNHILVSIVKPRGGDLNNLLDKAGVPYIETENMVWWSYPAGTDKIPDRSFIVDNGSLLVADYTNIIKSLDFDFVATNSIVQPWPAMAAKLSFKPHIWTIGESIETMISPFEKEQIMRFIDSNSTKILAASKFLKKELSKFVNKGKIDVVYPPIQTKDIFPQASNHKERSKLRLISVGSISDNKGQLDVVKAVQMLAAKDIKSELVLVGAIGSSTYMKKIQTYIKKNELNDFISILQHVQDVYPIMNQADVVIVSSRSEGFGRVVVEAMLMSKVIVATKSGGPEELITSGQNGFLYSAGNINELSTILTKLTTDVELRKRISKKAKENIPSMLSKNSVKKVSDFLLKQSMPFHEPSVNEIIMSALVQNNILLNLHYKKTIAELDKMKGEKQELFQKLKAYHQDLLRAKRDLKGVIDSKGWKTTLFIRNINSLIRGRK